MAESEQRVHVTVATSMDADNLLDAAKEVMPEAGPVVSQENGDLTLTFSTPGTSPPTVLVRVFNRLLAFLGTVGIVPGDIRRMEFVDADWEDDHPVPITGAMAAGQYLESN